MAPNICVLLISLVTSALRHLVGIRNRVMLSSQETEVELTSTARGHPGLPWRTRKMLSSVSDPKGRVKRWEGSGR